MLQGESGAEQSRVGEGEHRGGVGRRAMKVVVVREARLAGSKSDGVWRGDKRVKQKREYMHWTKMYTQH